MAGQDVKFFFFCCSEKRFGINLKRMCSNADKSMLWHIIDSWRRLNLRFDVLDDACAATSRMYTSSSQLAVQLCYLSEELSLLPLAIFDLFLQSLS